MSGIANPIIVWLDHDAKLLDRVVSAVRKVSLTRTDLKTLGELYDFRQIIIRAEDRGVLLESARMAIEEIPGTPAVILVDLSFSGHKLPEDVLIGRELAIGLTREFQKTAIGVYTRMRLGPRESSIVSSDGFAVVLDDMNAALEGDDRTRIQGEDWHSLFQKIISNSQGRMMPAVLKARYGRGVTRWAPGHPSNKSLSLSHIALSLTDLALDWLDPAPSQITISQMGGGFSGSLVLKADVPQWPKSYIVKIDEDPKKLTEELEGYQRVRTLVRHQYYLPLLQPNQTQPVTLVRDWWGAFAMEYDGRSKPLIDHSAIEGTKLAEIYHAFVGYEEKVIGHGRHEELHAVLEQLNEKYS